MNTVCAGAFTFLAMPGTYDRTDAAADHLARLREALAGQGWAADLTPDGSALRVANPGEPALAETVVCNGTAFAWRQGGPIAPAEDLDLAVQRITWVLACPTGAEEDQDAPALALLEELAESLRGSGYTATVRAEDGPSLAVSSSHGGRKVELRVGDGENGRPWLCLPGGVQVCEATPRHLPQAAGAVVRALRRIPSRAG